MNKDIIQENKYKVQDLDEYIRQGEPQKRERSKAWKVAIGLQKVDRLQTSEYLLDTAKRHIEGDISIIEAKQLIDSYYKSASGRKVIENDRTEEADKVAARITELIEEKSFSFTPAQLISIHRRLFDGIYKLAGRIHDYNITKNEWVLGGKTVYYASADTVSDTLNYDMGQEREFCYANMNIDEAIRHLTRFCANLWQVHAFCEGNTRTTAVFVIKYLRSCGFKVNNELFADNSWYFRNALVRANYRNPQKGIQPDKSFLVKFFRNLLLGEKNELKNRYMLIGYKDKEDDTHTSTHTSTRTSSNDIQPSSDNVKRLILSIGKEEMSVKNMMEAVGLKNRPNFLDYSLTPAINEGFVCMKYPDNPHHPKQKYLLTVKGLMLLDENNC